MFSGEKHIIDTTNFKLDGVNGSKSTIDLLQTSAVN